MSMLRVVQCYISTASDDERHQLLNTLYDPKTIDGMLPFKLERIFFLFRISRWFFSLYVCGLHSDDSMSQPRRSFSDVDEWQLLR